MRCYCSRDSVLRYNYEEQEVWECEDGHTMTIDLYMGVWYDVAKDRGSTPERVSCDQEKVWGS